MNNLRLDLYLVNNKLCETRNKAQELIKSSCVLVNNVIITKPNTIINQKDSVEIVKKFQYVSRAGYKLKNAIDEFKVDLNNKIVLDVGSSTGGFADCCLQNGAKKVYCLDVGSNQLHHTIKNNKNVVELSNTNIKDVNIEMINDVLDIIVSDISFISSKFMFENIIKLKINSETKIISLIKPQFELTKEILNKHNGVVKEEKYHQQAIDNVITAAKKLGFKCLDVIESPITGAKLKNKEFLGLFMYEK